MKIPFLIQNDGILLRKGVKQQYSSKIPNFQFPLLKVDIMLEPSEFKAGGDEIERFILEERFFTSYEYIEQDSHAKAGEQFVLEKVKPQIDFLFLNPILAFASAFKGSARSIRFNQVNYVYLKLIPMTFSKGLKAFWSAIFQKRKFRKEHAESKDNFMAAINEWVDFLQGKDYHGGDKPNQADFVVIPL